jgi:hypothetical protein
MIDPSTGALSAQDFTKLAIEPSAERYFIFLLLFVFSLVERKNEQQINS